MRFIIIDNETNRQRNLRSILGSLGYKSADVESFDDGEIGLANMKKRRFDVAFITLDLPKLSGLDVLRSMRSSGRLKDLPAILYGSEVTKEDILAAVQAGANSFLGHPFSVSDVESVIRQATRKAKIKPPE